MKFSAREDVQVPIGFAFDYVSDFKAFERMAMRRGVTIRRQDDLKSPGVGMIWDIRFNYRGKPRVMDTELQIYQVPHKLRFASKVGGLNVETAIELVALSPNKTRIFVSFDLRPRSLSARLLLQSLRLAKGKLTKRYKARIAAFAEDIETQHGR
ncbi:SRPBCC family protein [Parasulfitobacter algicola]|uniref:SRPBCC family protein n=1 Tax=Parasulfitobacter algicola TaxID=2614809 RepID=A0ABX2IWT7_9RHOB|nr:SRPBCC family protein [Sulfitobacter algicola]NSX54846.1 SRPBCC family protein [Sulfitobacter algicola]